MGRIIFCSILLSVIALQGFSQLRGDTARPVKKKFLRAAGELVITELLPWSFNRFVRKAEFAKVSFKSIGTNLKPSSWEWDDNNFKTNQFAHPYHGNLYYSTFRTNGYSFWQSAPAAFAGSFLWEIAGETHFPAPNDFINTSLGGIALGEMTYRIANKIVNNGAVGMKRQLQEVVALVINPVNGLNRILDGNWGRVYGDTDSTALAVYLNIGTRHFNIRTLNEYTKGNNELYFRLRLLYGDRYKPSNIPFESFYAQIEAGGGDSTYLNTVQVIGALKTWTLQESPDQLHLYSVTMNYDFIKNNAFQYGGQSFTFRLLSDWFRKGKTKLYTEIGSGIVVLGAVPDKYLYYGEGRNYDYGPGISLTTSVFLNVNNRFETELNYKGSRFKTVNGNNSSFILNTLSADVRVRIVKDFTLAAGIGQYTLNGFYKGFRNVAEIYPFARFSVGYKFD
ncbi:protein of unknown function [Chitinophaga sp. YR627]|uniref:DUF3943 domain-containing protein n=1 Tax=Chitinophaga sp. YR627 TaxID=1881041 RepID=UPI0008DFD97A|nr:DUF3943 domain-containing protein [Chitinophaga sp. YR627]SFN30017.1 protein of unknown function [Chitinophaga sp. YR627]